MAPGARRKSGLRERVLKRAAPAFACLRRFFGDERASVTVDFVISIPILLAVLVLTTEYGRMLQMRSTLENAVADAARYLSRVPLDASGAAFPAPVVEMAEGLIVSRVNTPYLAIAAPVVGDAGGVTTVRLSAAAGVPTPALGILAIFGSKTNADGLPIEDIEGLVITASETVRHFGR